MTDKLQHPTPERLDAYVEDALDSADRAVVESHLVVCADCQHEVEEMRTLFAALASLPEIAPSTGFAERVMADVRVRRPWIVRVADWVSDLLPKTTGGWAILAAVLTLPTLAGGGAMAWLFTRPWFTLQGLWAFGAQRTTGLIEGLAVAAGAALASNPLIHALTDGVAALVQTAGVRGLGAGIAVFFALTGLSGWVLYQNIFRTPTRDHRYVTHSF